MYSNRCLAISSVVFDLIGIAWGNLERYSEKTIKSIKPSSVLGKPNTKSTATLSNIPVIGRAWAGWL